MKIELNLVIDASAQMTYWDEVIKGLEYRINSTRAFKPVHQWLLTINAINGQPELIAKTSSIIQPEHYPTSILANQSGCRTLLWITDCSSPAWQTGKLLPLLHAWSQETFLSLCPVLPYRLWRRTGIRNAYETQVRSLSQPRCNADLITQQPPIWPFKPGVPITGIPLLIQNSAEIRAWTQLVTGKPTDWIHALVFPPANSDVLDALEQNKPNPPKTPEERIERFYAASSRPAWELAVCLSIVEHLNLSIIRLIQKAPFMKGSPDQSHLIEVLMGGILYENNGLASPIQANQPSFEFYPGVRELLRGYLPRNWALSVLQVVSKFISEYTGTNLLDFNALLAYPDRISDLHLETGNLEFARSAADVLIRYGGKYATLAARLKDVAQEAAYLQSLQAQFAKSIVSARKLFPTGVLPELFSQELLVSLPHPLSFTCAAYNQAENSSDRFAALDQLLINLTKYLTAISLSLYWQDSPDRELLSCWLSELSGAHLTTSLTILEHISQYYVESGKENPLQAVLFAPYQETLSQETPLGLVMQALKKQQPDNSCERDLEEVSIQVFLKHLLILREVYWEGSAAKIEPGLRDVLLPALRLALQEIIQQFRVLLEYRLYYIESVTRAQNEWSYALTTFSGPEGVPESVEWPYVQVDGKEPKCEVGYLYLFDSQKMPLLNLHPILIEHHLKLYFLEQRVKKGEIWYCHCVSTDRYQPPAYYQFISTRFEDPAKTAENKNDLVAQLSQEREEQREADYKDRIAKMPLNILLARLSFEARSAMEIGLGEALRIGQFWLGVEFLLMGFSRLGASPLSSKLAAIGVQSGSFRGILRGLVPVNTTDWRKQRDVQSLGAEIWPQLQIFTSEQLQASYGTEQMPSAILTPRLLDILREAVHLARDGKVSDCHLLLVILAHSHSIPVNQLLKMVFQSGQDPRHWVKQLEQELFKPDKPPAVPLQPSYYQPRLPVKPTKATGSLAQLGRDLTALAHAGALRPAVGEGARKAMTQIGLILQQTQANNPILLGGPGVGKTAVAEGLAWCLANDPDVVPQLAGKHIIDLSASALLVGTKYRGDLEERLGQVLAEVREAKGEIIVFIDEIHTILGGRAEGGLGALADALKPALARGEFPCIGATTVGEYRRYIEADPALAQRFTPVWLEEPSPNEAIEIATWVAREHLGPSHKVEYPDEVIAEAVRLAVRYLHDEFLPGKVIKLLDQAGPRATMGFSLRGAAADPTLSTGGKVTLEIVRQIVAERTGIPLASLSQDDKSKLLGLEESLKRQVKGQDEAVAEVAQMVKRARAGLSDPGRPLGVFLFAGPTGVGKTELALALAEALFDQEDAILRLDMSEYLEKHQISRLIGSPPGYIGYEEEGQLTGHLRRRPYSVVLLDEIEKAHKDVQHLLLQLFDAGRITDGRQRTVDGRNAIFIMTINLGAKGIAFKAGHPSYEAQLKAAIEAHFSPEFLSRVNRVICFNPLSEDLLLAIFDKFLAQAVLRFKDQGITVEVSEAFKRALCQKHTDAKRGARPLQRAIEDEIIAPLTDQLLAGEIGPGMRVEVLDMPHAEPNLSPSAWTLFPAPFLDESVNLALLEKLARQFEQESGLSLTLTDGAREILYTPHWTQSRQQLAAPQAFEQLARAPLLERIQAGVFQPGGKAEVFRNIDQSDFRVHLLLDRPLPQVLFDRAIFRNSDQNDNLGMPIQIIEDFAQKFSYQYINPIHQFANYTFGFQKVMRYTYQNENFQGLIQFETKKAIQVNATTIINLLSGIKKRISMRYGSHLIFALNKYLVQLTKRQVVN